MKTDLKRVPTICCCGDHAFVPLTRGYVTLVDVADAHLLVAHLWTAKPDKYTAYAQSRVARRNLRLHRLIVDASVVDHRNGDGLDNRRRNLRPASVTLNTAHRKHQKPSASGYVGVYPQEAGNYRASISIDGKNRMLGTFADPAEAARVRDKVALERYGEFAVLNFPALAAKPEVQS